MIAANTDTSEADNAITAGCGIRAIMKGKAMKIKMTVTEIEADARELRESNTLGENLAMMLSRAFQNREPLDDEEEGEPDDKP